MTARAARRRAPAILFAQELGAGFGHVTNLLAVAARFPDARRVFAVPHPRLTGDLVAARLGPEVRRIQAPRLESPLSRGDAPDPSLALILDRLGFGDGAAVAVAVAAWRDILAAETPDLVVSDFAPTLRIAAAGSRPHVVIGNGFAIPPDRAPVEPFRPTVALSTEMRAAEERVLRAANAARRLLGRPPLPRFASLLHGDQTFVRSYPELDPFADRRLEPPLDPLNVPPVPLGPPLDHRVGPHVVCYLDPREMGTDPVLTALSRLRRPSRVFVRDIDPGQLAPHLAPHVEVSTGLVDQGAAFPQARLVIHPGGQGTSAAALLAGTPQLLVPHSVETELTAERLVGLGVAVGLRIGRSAEPDQVRAVIESMLADRGFGIRARAVAERLQARRVSEPERPVVEACRAILVRERR